MLRPFRLAALTMLRRSVITPRASAGFASSSAEEEAKACLARADAVCFDVDSTVRRRVALHLILHCQVPWCIQGRHPWAVDYRHCSGLILLCCAQTPHSAPLAGQVITEEGIDVLADHLGKGPTVAALTASAMGGTMLFQAWAGPLDRDVHGDFSFSFSRFPALPVAGRSQGAVGAHPPRCGRLRGVPRVPAANAEPWRSKPRRGAPGGRPAAPRGRLQRHGG